jgi:membrane fusion protein (multidrug efflux system)
LAKIQPEKADSSALRREPAEEEPTGPATPSPGVVPLPRRQEQVSEPAKSDGGPPPSRWRRSRRTLLFALLPLALIAGGYAYVTGGQIMSTDDAYVEAEKVGVSTDVSGIVKEVDVTENQHVAPGQVLYWLDPRQFQIALDNAKANLAETKLTIEAMKQDYRRMLRDIDAGQAQVELDQATYDRYAALVKSDAVSKANYD